VIAADTKVLDALAEFCRRWPIAGMSTIPGG
jgi:hypothetical protein